MEVVHILTIRISFSSNQLESNLSRRLTNGLIVFYIVLPSEWLTLLFIEFDPLRSARMDDSLHLF